MWLLGIVSIIYVVYQLIKEACEKPIPAENWANKDLMHQDLMNGISIEQHIKYAKQGRYRLPENSPNGNQKFRH